MHTFSSARHVGKGAPRRRRQGGAMVPVLALLLILAGALGFNYHRNYVAEKETEAKSRPFARYPTAEIPTLLEAYRMELSAAQLKQVRSRVQTRDRYHFSAQIKEFERVQQETRKVRDRAIDVAEIQSNIAALESEQQRRASPSGDIMLHVTRLFRI